MKRLLRKLLFPQTLFAQTLLVLLLGIGLALLAGAWIYSSAREEAVRAVGALGAAERIINVSRLVAEAPADWRVRLVEGSSDASFRVALSSTRPTSPGEDGENSTSRIIADFIKKSMPARAVVVAVAGSTQPPSVFGLGHLAQRPHFGPGPGFGRGMHGEMMHGPLARAVMSWRALNAHVELPDGQWLAFTMSLPDEGPRLSFNLMLALIVMAGIVALLTAWAARRLTAPLRVLSDAATRLGRNVEAPPLVASGSVEMRRAAEAFNDMQGRLRSLIKNRTLMLAAISHDLRTQLTLLRLRTEAAAASDDKERMLRTIGEMEEMLTATLSFARDEVQSEPNRLVDLGALVSSIVDDMADAGMPVITGKIADGAIGECKPAALRRAVTNLIDNAVKYGSKATVSIDAEPSGFTITVDDEGPGIPENQFSTVLEPFNRLESSRSRETGGIGLGLAIAASVSEAHDGKLSLSNRSQGGLRAQVFLPR